MAIFSITTLLARNTTLSLGDDDASNNTGLIFEEHDLRKTMSMSRLDRSVFIECHLAGDNG